MSNASAGLERFSLPSAPTSHRSKVTAKNEATATANQMTAQIECDKTNLFHRPSRWSTFRCQDIASLRVVLTKKRRNNQRHTPRICDSQRLSCRMLDVFFFLRSLINRVTRLIESADQRHTLDGLFRTRLAPRTCGSTSAGRRKSSAE